jgi:hypothetical protein
MRNMSIPVKIQKVLALIGLLAILGGVGAAAFFFGGFFNVAANHPDPGIVDWALIQVRQASIARQAIDRPPASLDDPALIRAGALAYAQSGCTSCHGGPWRETSQILRGAEPCAQSQESRR